MPVAHESTPPGRNVAQSEGCQAVARTVRPLTYLFRDTPLYDPSLAPLCNLSVAQVAGPTPEEIRTWTVRAAAVVSIYDELPPLPDAAEALADRHRAIAQLTERSLRLWVAVQDSKDPQLHRQYAMASIDRNDAWLLQDQRLVRALFAACALPLPTDYLAWEALERAALESASDPCGGSYDEDDDEEDDDEEDDG